MKDLAYEVRFENFAARVICSTMQSAIKKIITIFIL